MCGMSTAKLHKMCSVAHDVKNWHKSLIQKNKRAVSGSQGCAYM